ncbi:helix-turn-helix transcriptional regulator [Desulfovibrio inopinatus]|uniref:helix-turn-helix transcriptional regulator n=1 Tax=Desulfovibrio inopinatus TaxID=102109 RepID=UPI0004125BD2|nr:helix-turn-helix transcriptional regulator [Desulfovibrio inopinatus]
MEEEKTENKRGSRQGKPERYMQPSILMALLVKPTHGYDLIQEIPEYGFIRGDAPPGMVYRHLRQMEEDGLVESEWTTDGSGPAKRIYRITEIGHDVLDSWIVYMERQRDLLDRFILNYKSIQEQA